MAEQTRGDRNQFAVENIFPHEKLELFKVSPLVRSLNPDDFADMEKAFSVPPHPSDNPKIKQLTTHDLVSIEGLFAEYRTGIVANFHGGEARNLTALAAKGDTCCCCCTPCCCCCSAASQIRPFAET
jgi:hypothetical protein